MTHRGQVCRGYAVLVDGPPEELGRWLRRALDAGFTPFQLGLKVRAGHQPTETDLGWVGLDLIRFDLEDTCEPTV